jgi:tetratricopeptide (TPR) repeat protein
LDYEYRAKLLAKSGKDSLAIIDYKKALELQPEKIELNGDIANAYIKIKKYADAISAYKVKMEKGKPNVNDYFGITRAYYFSKDFINADSSAVQIIKQQPNLALGYMWRARANSQLDPKNEKWSAKPFYEEFIAKVKPEDVEKNKKDLIEAYNYLAAYYAEKKDCPNVKLYMQKVLDLDAANAQAKKVLAGLKC